MKLLKNPFSVVLLTCLFKGLIASAVTFVGSLSCCLKSWRPDDFYLLQNYCHFADGQCLCQNSPTAVDKCSTKDIGIFAGVEACCTGANLDGFAHGCAFQDDVCTCPNSERKYLSSCEFPRSSTNTTRAPAPSSTPMTSATPTTFTSTPGTPPIQCYTVADILFLLDSSSSVGPYNFKKELEFVTNLTASFKTGLDDVRIGLLAYTHEMHKQFDLKFTTDDSTALYKAILKTPYKSGGTSTHEAINFITTFKMFDITNGGRPNAPDIVILLTDGYSTNKTGTVIAAERLRKSGVKIFAVGIGPSVNQKELLDITGNKDYILRSTDFSKLGSISDHLVNITCDGSRVNDVHVSIVTAPTQVTATSPPTTAKPPVTTTKPLVTTTQSPTTTKPPVVTAIPSATPSKPHVVTATSSPTKTKPAVTTTTTSKTASKSSFPTTAATTISTSSPTPPPSPSPSVQPCLNSTKADIVLLMDASTSIGADNWSKQVRFADEITQAFNVGPNDVRFAAMIFNSEPEYVFDLKTLMDHQSISTALLGIRYPDRRGTYTDLALRAIRKRNMFSSARGGRGNAKDIVIVMTDGQSYEPSETKWQAQKLKDLGVTLISVGIGSEISRDELLGIASKPDYVLLSGGYSHLESIKSDLINVTCDSGKVVR